MSESYGDILNKKSQLYLNDSDSESDLDIKNQLFNNNEAFVF